MLFLYGKRAIFFHFLLACLVRPSVKPGTGSGSCSVTVITGDSESLNPGSIPGRTFFFVPLQPLKDKIFFSFFLPTSGFTWSEQTFSPYDSGEIFFDQAGRQGQAQQKKKCTSECKFRSYDLWVMSPTRFRCANSLLNNLPRLCCDVLLGLGLGLGSGLGSGLGCGPHAKLVDTTRAKTE